MPHPRCERIVEALLELNALTAERAGPRLSAGERTQLTLVAALLVKLEDLCEQIACLRAGE